LTIGARRTILFLMIVTWEVNMKYFRNFNTSIWEIFVGNLLLLFCSLFYLSWWIVLFQPNSSGSSVSKLFITIAFITGVTAIVLISNGIMLLSKDSKSLPVKFILLGSVSLFFVMILLTTIVFHRIVTSELIIIHIWTALELSVVSVLYGTRYFSIGRAITLTTLVGITFIVGLICYVIYYHLDKTASYWDGMVPLIMDAFVMVVFLRALIVS